MTRYLANSRAGDPDPRDVEGFDPIVLEGDAVACPADGIASLRPFGRDVAEQRLVEPMAAGTGLDRVRSLVERGRRLDAMLALRQLLETEPGSIEARIELARLLADGGDFDDAIEQLTRAAEVSASAAAILVRRGALYARSGQTRAAEQDFREAIRSDPTYWPAYRYLGTTRLRLGAASEAVTVLREALTLAPQDPETVLYLGEALLAVGRLEEALATLERAVGLLPTDPRGYTLLGRLYDRVGRMDEAMAMHRKAREVTTA